jgi:hypothetical protein
MIRKAEPDQVAYYEKKLYPLQDEVLGVLTGTYFYLSGGTCLSRFYYQHRYSDDLDLFFNGFQNGQELFNIEYQRMVNALSEKFAIEILMAHDFFKRIIVSKKALNLKIEFVYENYKIIGERKKIDNYWIDSKENIATNKMTTIYDRKMVKDFFDLYFLLKDFNLKDLIIWAQTKIVPMDYEGTLLALKGPAMEGEVLTKLDVDRKEFEDFIKQLSRDILFYAKNTG